jgi:thiosulfate/3-mercaptopyruvate sulfurtransferase
MRRITAIIALLLVIGVGAAPAYAGGVITVDELADMMDDANLRIISARQPDDYDKVHIKNAVNVWHKDLYQAGDVTGLLKSPEELAGIFGAKGISDTSTIVIYDDGSNKAAGRLYWILEYLGADDVRILDGHMKMWRKGRKPVTKDVPSFEPVTFTASPDEDAVATVDELQGDGVLLVDVRSEDEYNGTTGESERKGHIPGAVWYEYTNVVNDDGTVKSEPELRESLTAAGITPDKDVILYCETSVRAGVVYLVLHDMLGYPRVQVYDGAYQEWASDPSRPVE